MGERCLNAGKSTSILVGEKFLFLGLKISKSWDGKLGKVDL
jgi:hypothetical protein